MKFVRVLVLCGLALATNGCTVLGLATDLAIISASDGEKNRSGLNKKGVEPFFTQQGLKHDVEFVKNFMDKLPEKEPKPVSQEVNQALVLACNNVVRGKQQCYPPEYYRDMYIKSSMDDEAVINSPKD